MNATPTDSRELVLDAIDDLYRRALDRLKNRIGGPKSDPARLEAEQLAAHALAYLATELEACRQLHSWANRHGEPESRIADAYTGSLATQLRGGVDLGSCESIGLDELGLEAPDLNATILRPDVERACRSLAREAVFLEIAQHAAEGAFGDRGLDEELDAMRRDIGRFVDEEVRPIAQEIHRQDVLIPMRIVDAMAELGVFGMTIPEDYDGLGMGKVAMCVVTEELSRGYIGVGSLGTRSEIAAELILGGGTEAQKTAWLPRIARGEVLPTAVFTEPDFGSDLAHLRTRAERQEDGSYQIHGQKTWITHGARANLMTLLARTSKSDSGYRGLSMFLAEKTSIDGEGDRPAHAVPPDTLSQFVDPGLSGTEIEVLGYRGMKEYELAFDGFVVPETALLGEVEGRGFKQLMQTFESARIQTAARGVGLAQGALEDALGYAQERSQFGKPLLAFPRVARKIGRMICRIQAARQLTYFAARQKDSTKRCDLEAGMAKLLATRAAWEAADANVQIHGGNGYAVEYTASRLLVDARVLSIFEGANEIQAHVVARRLLEEAWRSEEAR